MTRVSELESMVLACYGGDDVSVRSLAGSWDGNVYLVQRAGFSPWVLRIVDRVSAQADARVLTILEEQQYPAPLLIHSRDGRVCVDRGGDALLVTTFIGGRSADFSPHTLHDLGEMLGRLHTLGGDVHRAALTAAEMLPATDMQIALDWLESVAAVLPPGLRQWHDTLLDAICAISDSAHLPCTLIHNDCHPGNAVVTADGATVLIDWHGAGLGPPMVDLGFLLISSEIRPSWALPPLSPDPRRVNAIVAGYARHRMPTAKELEWLPDAMRFRGLLYGAAHLAQAAERGLEALPETWWWERYQAADEVARRACAAFRL